MLEITISIPKAEVRSLTDKGEVYISRADLCQWLISVDCKQAVFADDLLCKIAGIILGWKHL